jgi:hypothetical protein
MLRKPQAAIAALPYLKAFMGNQPVVTTKHFRDVAAAANRAIPVTDICAVHFKGRKCK